MPYAHQFAALATHLESIIGQGGYAILLILTLLEGIPVIGMAVPGHIAIVIAGFFARIGTLNLWWVMAISIFGAIVGDYIGFALGRKYGISFIDRIRPYFFVTDVHLEKARVLIGKHTGKAMIIGRFTPATRPLMPFLVGASHTPAGRFWIFNIIGGVTWAVSSILLGYIFGFGYHAVAQYFGRFILIGIGAAILILWGYRFVNSHFHIFRRYELFTLALNLVSLGFLALMIQDAFTRHAFMVNPDAWVSSFMNSINHGSALGSFLGRLAAVVSDVGGTAVMGVLGFILMVWFALKKKWRSAAIVAVSLASTAGALGLLKEFFMRARPENALQVIVNDPSFPSGHAAMSAAFCVVVAYLFAPKIGGWVRRELFLVFCVLVPILIGLSRLVLNVHWTSDVIAGWSLGVFLATASVLTVRYVGTLLVRKSV